MLKKTILAILCNVRLEGPSRMEREPGGERIGELTWIADERVSRGILVGFFPTFLPLFKETSSLIQLRSSKPHFGRHKRLNEETGRQL